MSAPSIFEDHVGHSTEGEVSEVDVSLEQMVQAASVPSLADLFGKAKKQGLIGPVTVYGESA